MKQIDDDTYDLWDDKKVAPKAKNSEFAMKRKNVLKPHALKRKFFAKKIDESLPKDIANFLPSSGASYNPDTTDHLKLVATAVSYENKKDFNDMTISRMIPKPAKMSDVDKQIDQLRDILQSPLDASESVNDQKEKEIDPDDPPFPPQPPISLWKQKRLHAKNVKLKLKKAREKKLQNEARMREAHLAGKTRIKKLYVVRDRGINVEEKLKRNKLKRMGRIKKKEMMQKMGFDTKKLGKYKPDDVPEDVLASDDLPHTLRELHGSRRGLIDLQRTFEGKGLFEHRGRNAHPTHPNVKKKVITPLASFLKDRKIDPSTIE